MTAKGHQKYKIASPKILKVSNKIVKCVFNACNFHRFQIETHHLRRRSTILFWLLTDNHLASRKPTDKLLCCDFLWVFFGNYLRKGQNFISPSKMSQNPLLWWVDLRQENRYVENNITAKAVTLIQHTITIDIMTALWNLIW